MTEKRILLVGDGNHQFITNLALWLTKYPKNKFVIDIFSYTTLQKENKKYYNTIFGEIGNNLFYNIISNIKGVRRCFRMLFYNKILSSLPKYDVIHLHYLSVDSYFLIEQFKKKTEATIIISLWGSDMYRVKHINERGFIDACKKADIVTFTNQKSIDYFQSKYKWNKKNLQLCRFGLAPLKNLRNLSSSSEECKKLLGLDTKKLAISIGYNLSPAQQHLAILSQFENSEVKSLKDKIQLILPITYGGTYKYKNQLLKYLKQLPFDYTVYDTFLTNDKVAQIRKASDIMIQLQKTDQFSGSMQEHLFARNVVITGSWLPYQTIKEYGAWFLEVEEVEELSKVIPDLINNFQKYEQKTINNPQSISELSSWEKNIINWINLYKIK